MEIVPHLVVVGAVGALLHAGVLPLVSNLDANDRVHVQPRKLPGFDHCYAHLEVLGFQRRLHARFQVSSYPELEIIRYEHKVQGK